MPINPFNWSGTRHDASLAYRRLDLPHGRAVAAAARAEPEAAHPRPEAASMPATWGVLTSDSRALLSPDIQGVIAVYVGEDPVTSLEEQLPKFKTYTGRVPKGSDRFRTPTSELSAALTDVHAAQTNAAVRGHAARRMLHQGSPGASAACQQYEAEVAKLATACTAAKVAFEKLQKSWTLSRHHAKLLPGIKTYLDALGAAAVEPYGPGRPEKIQLFHRDVDVRQSLVEAANSCPPGLKEPLTHDEAAQVIRAVRNHCYDQVTEKLDANGLHEQLSAAFDAEHSKTWNPQRVLDVVTNRELRHAIAEDMQALKADEARAQ